MRDLGGEFLQTPLAIGNLSAEQVLMVAIERLALQIFVGIISQGHGGARQDILNPPVEARLFPLRRLQRGFDRFQDSAHARPVGFSVAIG